MRFGPIRVPDYARQTLDIRRKPQFSVTRFWQTPRLLKYGLAAGSDHLARRGFRTRIDVADHDRCTRYRKSEHGSAPYPCFGTCDQAGPPFKIDLKPFHMNFQK
jgi:hypothetical protein